MTEPTFDADGYPTEETLDAIRNWPITSYDDFGAVMDFAGRAWSYPDDRWECVERWDDPDWPQFPKRVYRFSTGGWSGNEGIVDAIEANQIVHMIGAWSWQRGGHYEYRFPMEAAGVTATPSTVAALLESMAVDPKDGRPATRWLSLSVALAIVRGTHPLASGVSLDAPPASDGLRSMETVRNWLGLDLWMALGHDFTDWAGWTADAWADMIAEVRAALAASPKEDTHAR